MLQVKAFYVGSDFVGDAPLSKKILAALTTGECPLVASMIPPHTIVESNVIQCNIGVINT